jgi:prepilin-type N-terminal cleavage/methylation domain-containing protein
MGFTLLELLVVVAIIAVLATLILGGLGAARRRTKVALAKNNIAPLKAALQMYETDTGKYPRRTYASGTAFANDITFVYAALRNRRTAAAGGGPNSPYLDWKPEQVGFADFSTVSDANFGNVTNNPGSDGFPRIDPVDPTIADQLNTMTYQASPYNPTGTKACTFLDPWGNPFVYREWASVPTATKDGFLTSPTSRSSNTGGSTNTEAHPDRPHDVSKFDIYSFGPNGVNEWGEGDDVTSWGEK